MDRAQENLHFITDIATDCIFVLDQEFPTLPQTPEDESSGGHQQRDYGSAIPSHLSSLESSDRESRDGTPQSPGVKFFNRSLSGPGSGTLSPAVDIPSRKSEHPPMHLPTKIHITNRGVLFCVCFEGSQGSQGSHGSHESPKNISGGSGGALGNGQSLDQLVNFKR